MNTNFSLLEYIKTGIFVKSIAALVILLVGFISARLLGLVSRVILKELSLNKTIAKYTSLRIAVEEIISAAVVYFIYFISIWLALNQLGIATKLLHAIGIAAITVILVSIIIALKDFVPNLLAGIYLLHIGHLKPKDRVSFDNVEAKILEIHLLETKMETQNKEYLLVPNSTLLKKIIKIKKTN